MVIDWKTTKHETLARASVADGFLQLAISKVEAWEGRGFVIKINGRKMRCRPATMHGAINAVDTMMQGPIGSILSGMEPNDTENPNSNRLTVSSNEDRKDCQKHGIFCTQSFPGDSACTAQFCDKICLVTLHRRVLDEDDV